MRALGRVLKKKKRVTFCQTKVLNFVKGAVKEVHFNWLLQRASDPPPFGNSVGYLIMTPNLYLMPIAPEANINA